MKRRAVVGGVGMALAVMMVASLAGQQTRRQKTPLEANPVGMFEGHRDVGDVAAQYAGNVEFDAAKEAYTVTGGGENIWFDHDAFQFAWKQASGNVTLAADIQFLGAGKNPHRKAVLMVRQNLEADAAYVDVAVHGVGLTSLQYRDEKGGMTHEVQANVNAPKRVKIVKRGDYFTMWVAGEDGKFALAGATGKIELTGPFYVGIGVCSHEKDLVERAVFSRVELGGGSLMGKGDRQSATGDQKTQDPPSKNEGGAPVQGGGKLYSMMEIMNVESTDRRAIYVAEGRFEAPNWTPDGTMLLFNRNGRLATIPVTGGADTPGFVNGRATNWVPLVIDTGFAVRCNNDHGISPDGKWLVVSDQSQDANHQSQIYILPIHGGTPQLITKNSPSYWHGWSPDGKTLAFVGQRNGEFDVYAIEVKQSSSSGAKAKSAGSENAGGTPGKRTQDPPSKTEGGAPASAWEVGEEKRLTTAKGLDDGPEYTPDGKYIYFNSERTGHMQIWKMKANGSEQEQVTFGPENDWFPHFSPDGQEMVFLTYDASVKGHPENKDVMLRMMNMKDGKIRVVAKLFGGQGTINVPSWSPDGKQIAFVSYAVVEE